MARTVFYSWQRDRLNSTNRTFIEKALEKAIKALAGDLELEKAIRDDPVELDQDTRGVPGSPAVADTIFKKIEACDVFVADLTFVGRSDDGRRPIPNPNVLIEYGWARKALGEGRIVAVMNEAFGGADGLPFDLRHLRHPLKYSLPESPSSEEKKEQRQRLVSELTRAVGDVLKAGPWKSEPEFVPTPRVAGRPATFMKPGMTFGYLDGGDSEPCRLPDSGYLYLRVRPTRPIETIPNPKRALDLLAGRQELNFGSGHDWRSGRNRFGAFVACVEGDGTISRVTELLLTRELWAIDAVRLNREKTFRDSTKGRPFIHSKLVKEAVNRALPAFVRFVNEELQVAFPLAAEAGLTGVEGYELATFAAGFQTLGACAQPDVIVEGRLGSAADVPAFLDRFAREVFAACGLDSSPSA